jgi:hypothetical protein
MIAKKYTPLKKEEGWRTYKTCKFKVCKSFFEVNQMKDNSIFQTPYIEGISGLAPIS